ncbi:unnamed protein product [Blepharisma stoltei]|uniref:Receptor ligand binding region domain-containing protein n=1 Tax=Blepharisma stoltei TaxID=1481888 RepID=A0AAU9J5V8_9CILI|nr:unnamed protein product [Blepharisma stoltei]
MKKFLICSIVMNFVLAIDVTIITSQFTLPFLQSYTFISPYNSVSLNCYNVSSSSDLAEYLSFLQDQAILDFTNSLIFSEIISYFSEKQNLLHVELNAFYSLSAKNSFSLAIPIQNEILSTYQLLKSLNLYYYGIIYLQEYNDQYVDLIDSATVALILPHKYSDDYLKILLNRYIRYSSVNTIILLLPGKLSAQILQVAGTDFEDLGFVWILMPIADYLQYSESTSLEDNGPILMYSSLTSLESKLSLFYEILNICSERSIGLIKCFEESLDFDENHDLLANYDILNTQNSTYINVGSATINSCTITDALKWSHGSKLEKTITISQDAGLYSAAGAYLSFLVPSYNGNELGVNYVNNNSTILKGFKLKRNSYNFGSLYYNKTFMDAEFERSKSQLKTLMIAPALSDVAIHLYQTMQDNSLILPMIGYSTTVDKLSSPITFPMFSRVNMASGYIGYVLGIILKYFGWSKVGVLYLNNVFAQNVFSAFKTQCEQVNLQITNEGNEMLPDNSPSWTYEEIDPVLSYLGKSDARIILMICYTQDATSILTRMWELGYHGDNRVYIAVGWLASSMVMQDKSSASYNETQLHILRESLRGALMFFPVSYAGAFGQKVYNDYLYNYKSDPIGYTGFAFDSILASAYAIEQVIAQGKDYNNPSILMSAIRNIRFTGATGLVKIEQNTNDRATMDHSIYNCQEISPDSWEIKIVGVYSPTGSQVFTYYESIIWPDGTINTPPDSPKPRSCPFDNSQVKSSITGHIMVCLIGTIILLVAVLSSLFTWKYWKSVIYSEIDKRTEMTFYDMMAISRILIEFFQLVGIAPEIPAIFHVIKFVGNALSLNLDKMYRIDRTYFWISIQAVFAAIGMAFVIRIAYIVKIHVPFLKVIMSIIWDLFYVAILSTLMNIFVCKNGIGKELDETYLYFDCYTTCWGGKHLVYAVIAFTISVIYVLLAVIERPRWQTSNSNEQNVQLLPSFLTVKSLVFTLLIVVKKMVNTDIPELYLAFFLFICICYLVIIIYEKPYNLKILNLWYMLSMMALCWLNFIGILYYIMAEENIALWLSLVAVGWSCVCCGGLAYQKSKKLYWPFNSGFGKNTNLFKFAFKNSSIMDAKKIKHQLRILKLENSPTLNEITFGNRKDIAEKTPKISVAN